MWQIIFVASFLPVFNIYKQKFMRLITVSLICFVAIACNQATESKNTNTADPAIANILTPSPDTNLNTTPPASTAASSTGIYDIWVLDSINANLINPADYTGGTPYIEFNAADGKFSAHSGCNSIKGIAVVNDNYFSINKLEVSKNACKNKTVENNFIKAISDKKAGYKIENNKLYLTSGAITHIFRRINR